MKTRGAIVVFTVVSFVFILLFVIEYPYKALEIVLPDQTLYSQEFTEDKWNQISIGMTSDEVISILGYPLRITEIGTDGEYRARFYEGDRLYKECYSHVHPPQDYHPDLITHTWMSYSMPGGWLDSYFARSIKVDREGIVVEKQGSYYHD